MKKEQRDGDPYWILLPRWLAGLFLRSRTADQRFLQDALCGQYCAFLAVKIHDDLFDGHIEDRSLIYAADDLILSAREAFAPHFPASSSFWPFLESSFRRTFNAVAAVDHSQLHGYGSPTSVAALTSQTYAVCNLATYAVCLRTKRLALFRGITRCTDELAYVGQLLDDLEDMDDDLQRGRTNYAAYSLLEPSIRRRRNVMQQMAREIILLGSADRFFNMLHRHLRRANKFAELTRIPQLTEHVRNYREALESSEALLHQERVELVFKAVTRGKDD